MKIIHTADWHLGQTFFEYDRKREHTQFLAWLREQVTAHSVDVLLVAGDVFDTPNPSAQSQRQYYTFLKEITAENPALQIIIIAGNHDSAARLEAPNPLLETMNVTVRGVVRRTEDGDIDCANLIVPLDKGGCCLAVPYLRQGDYPDSATYAEGVQAMYRELFERVQDKNKPIIAMGHLQATGSDISQNDRAERTIIGGLECISPEAFNSQIAYTALGHLHRAQRVSGRENVRYAGAPLPMSFAEKNNKQGVTLVTITDTTEIERLEFDAPIKLMSIEPLPLVEVLAEIEKLPDGEVCETSPFLEIKVLITEPEPSLRMQIEKALEGKNVRLARVEAKMCSSENNKPTISYEELQKINPLDMATDIFKRKYGGDAIPQTMKELLETVIREVER
ncbi:MAG: exonuclease SbcCD subunit D C-terminal domain-containing protein [Bacteroidales bacterium]